jgi:hypothetical protein
MKFLSISKDGGEESNVWAYWLIEIKPLFSIALLRFENGTREAYHSHAFNCISWLLSGGLGEEFALGYPVRQYQPSIKPIITKRETFHKVYSRGRSWVLTFRGPWKDTWLEHKNNTETTLTHGRKVVQETKI